MTLSSPPAGGVFCISGSTPAGGHMTPFESASLSLSDWEGWLRPTVGGSPFTSGGQAGGAAGRTSAWANAVAAEMMLAHRAIERVATRKRWFHGFLGATNPQINVPHAGMFRGQRKMTDERGVGRGGGSARVVGAP
jgi:hypothetical protein